MDKPKQIPLNPETPKAKQVKTYRMSPLYPESMSDDVYIRPDNDSVYTPIQDSIKNLETHEDSENSN